MRIASVFVMQSHVDGYLKRMLNKVIPEYQAAEGLLTVMILRRSLVGYEEITTITTWHSREYMQSFFESKVGTTSNAVLIQREPAHDFDVVFHASRSLENES